MGEDELAAAVFVVGIPTWEVTSTGVEERVMFSATVTVAAI